MHRLLVSLSALTLVTAGCGSHAVRVPQAPSPQVQAKLANMPRVWIAGFVSERRPETKLDFDLNAEAVRLVRTHLRTWSSAQVIQAEPLRIDNEQRLSDVPYWRRQGEEHGQPLIVTGSLKLLLAPPKSEQRGRHTMYFPLGGRVLETTVVVIDGRSGEVLSTNKLPGRVRYGFGRLSSDLSLFLNLMDRSLPDWLGAIASAPRTSPDRESLGLEK